MAVCISAFYLCASALAQAADSSCSTASTVNPNKLNNGMGGTSISSNNGLGGTGVTSDSGLGGTGITKDNGLGGTGVTNDNGFGGTGITADGGMGGTGISAEHGGIGGTGDARVTSLLPADMQGGVAIIGIVTGFASICVIDEEVFYDKNTPVYDNGFATRLSNIATGKMVMLKADKVGGQLRARSIGLFYAIAGPVEHIDIKLNKMLVMGQTVRLNQEMMLQLHQVDANKTVARVSGHRLDNGDIVATRIDIGETGNASTIGLVTSVNRDSSSVNSVFVNGTKVTTTNKNALNNIKVGNELRVSGKWDGRSINADQVELQPITNSVNRADAAIIEGFVKLGRENSMSIGGTEIIASQGITLNSSVEKSLGKVVKIEMRRDSKGHWIYDKLEQRSGKLFDQHGAFTDDMKPNGKDDNNANSGKESLGEHDSNNGKDASSDRSGDNSGSSDRSSSGRDSSSDRDSSSGRDSSGSARPSDSGRPSTDSIRGGRDSSGRSSGDGGGGREPSSRSGDSGRSIDSGRGDNSGSGSSGSGSGRNK